MYHCLKVGRNSYITKDALQEEISQEEEQFYNMTNSEEVALLQQMET